MPLRDCAIFTSPRNERNFETFELAYHTNRNAVSQTVRKRKAAKWDKVQIVQRYLISPLHLTQEVQDDRPNLIRTY